VATVFRPARAEELQQAQELVVRSINDLTERHGFGPMAALRSPDFQLFSMRDDPDGLWVAEADGEMLGFAFSWVCGGLWFLAELFVSPVHQGRGIGNELLTRTLEQARKVGATNKALITFTFNTISQGLYIRHGLFPRLPIYFFNVEHDALIARFQGEELRYTDIEQTAAHRACLAQIDASTVGISREKHHRYLLNDTTTRGILFYAGRDCIGYAYVNSNGHIGPVAVAEPNAMGAAFRTTLKIAAGTGASQVSAFLPGVNDATLSIAAAHGMRITFPMVLVSAREFGDWTRYLPRNPGFM
jgi:ribosomal protein S18 acetylase RimI-like enzyme